MNRYLLNSAVLTAAGEYTYRILTIEEATTWLRAAPFASTVGYAETAAALAAVTGVEVPVDRRTIRMEAGDEALVFRLVLPPNDRRIPVDDKGRLGVEFILAHCEVGLLRRSA